MRGKQVNKETLSEIEKRYGGIMNETQSCGHTDAAEDDRKVAERLAKIKHTLIVLSGKGGVGKSTVAVNLAMSLSMKGFKTGLLDVDIHGPSIPTLLDLKGQMPVVNVGGIEPLECWPRLKAMSIGLLLPNDDSPIIWRGPMKGNAIKQLIGDVLWGELDYLVVDCPPGTGDEPLSVAQLVSGKSSGIIVTTPQQVATVDVAKCVTFCKSLNMPVEGIIENMGTFVCPHCGKETDIFSRGGGLKLALRMNVPFLGNIPLDPEIVQSGDNGKPYVYYYPKSRTAERFEEIIAKIIARSSEQVKTAEFLKIIPENVIPKNGKQSPQNGDLTKFAVPTTGKKLCQHFGHCEAFAIMETEHGRVVSETYVDAPEHEPGLLPKWLAEKGVQRIIAGGMGSTAKGLFAERGIDVITGAQAEDPRQAVELYLKGALDTGVNTCDH
jgi:ATP-binding protein involved in chromosome partitioning